MRYSNNACYNCNQSHRHVFSMQAFSIAEGTIKWLQADENDRPRSECDIAEVTSGSVAEVTHRSAAELAHFFLTGVTSAIRLRYRRSNFQQCLRSHFWNSLRSDFTFACRRYLEESFPIGKTLIKTYFFILSIFCIYFVYKGFVRLYTRSLACRKFCWSMLFRSSSVDIRNLLITISKGNRNKNYFLFSQGKNKLEDITFYNEVCWESLDPQSHAK